MLLPLAESVRTYFQAHGFPTIVDRICLEESLAPPVPHSVDALRLGWCFLHILSILPQTASIVSASFPVPLLLPFACRRGEAHNFRRWRRCVMTRTGPIDENQRPAEGLSPALGRVSQS